MVGFELNLIRGKVAWAFVAGVSVVHSRLAIHFLERLFSLTQISVITYGCLFCWSAPVVGCVGRSPVRHLSLVLSHRRSVHGQILSLDRLCSFL